MKKIVIALLLLVLTGCDKEDVSVNLEINCDNVTNIVEVKQSDTLSCNLLGENYEFKITKIKNDGIYIEANKYGLTSSGSLLSEEKEFVLNKDSSITLTTQSTDYQEKVVFNWK